MAIDPIASAVALTGMFLNKDANDKAVAHAKDNEAITRALMMGNVGQQLNLGEVAHSYGKSIDEFARGSGDQLKGLIEQYVANQRKASTESGAKQNALADELANLDISTAQGGSKAITDIAKSTRTDAYGNKITYDPTKGGWQTNLTAAQGDLARSTEGAQRSAMDALNQALAEYRFGKGPAEDVIRGELTGLMSQANANEGGDRARILGQQALRIGQGASIPQIIKAIEDNVGAKLPRTLLDARSQALSEFNTRENARVGRLVPAISQLSTPIRSPDSLTGATALSQKALDDLISATTTGAGLTQAATKTAGDRRTNAMSETNARDLATIMAGDTMRVQGENTASNRVIGGLDTNRQIIENMAKGALGAVTGGITASNDASKAATTALTKSADLGDVAKLYTAFSGGKTAAADPKKGANEDLIAEIMSNI